jgi:hypothetical protein
MSDPENQSPTARQLLHAATGDREAEAEELADRTGEEVDAARDAVRAAHHEIPGGPDKESDLASPSEVHEAARERDDTG